MQAIVHHILLVASVENNKKVRVLLADDDEDDLIFFREAISIIEFMIDLEVVGSGTDLMKRLHDKNNFVPDLVFLDLNMPRKNGIECLREIRKSDHLKEVPIVIYSTSSSNKDISETNNLGANLYFTKPSSFDNLVKSLQNIFSINWRDYVPKVELEKYVLGTQVGSKF